LTIKEIAMTTRPLITLVVLMASFIAVTAGYSPTPAMAATDCMSVGVGAQIYSTAVSTPTPGTLLERGPIRYVADDAVDVALTLSFASA
jgi:hypothetical protein